MKSIVFVLLLLLGVVTSGQMISDWGNLTVVHEDGGADEFWDSLSGRNNYIFQRALQHTAICTSSAYEACIKQGKIYNSRACTTFNRCKRGR
ncbi:hypothetical protein ISN44_As12g036740 [Arabidopsis suecica]|uniref:Uncharacterized protein n=1 Tax=Arabidopsis suecica TaxID=45249 RepID=A0A8T1YQE7_ARASU|nr:hypothetical protein ISN44_As12g036740 [Arabidopsis suecica]